MLQRPATTKVDTLPLQAHQNHNFLTGALRTMMRENRCALHFSLESANSKGQQGRGALVAITNATNVDPSDRNLTTCVTTQTEASVHVRQQYRIQIHLYLWKFLRDEGPCQEQ